MGHGKQDAVRRDDEVCIAFSWRKIKSDFGGVLDFFFYLGLYVGIVILYIE